MDESLLDDMAKIRLFLETKANALAIILCGSRSVGDYKENSDWDLKILVEKEPDYYNPLEGYDLDCSVHHPHTHFTPEEFGLKLRFCEIISDTPSKDAQRIIDEAHTFYNKGPKSWTKDHALDRQKKVRRYEKKFKDCIASSNWFELHQRLNWHFLENSYSWWYGIRREWEPRPQNIMSDLLARDPEFASILEKITHPEISSIDKSGLFHQLHRGFFESEVYQHFIKD